ncbi:MAG: PilZ domain-containing protein [Candidatus Omnitrophota bacterium]
MAERRKFVRLDMRIPIRWENVSPSGDSCGGSANSDTAKNICRGGICIIMAVKPSIGDILNIKVDLPSKRFVTALGKVIWMNELYMDDLDKKQEFDVGIEFLKITKEDEDELNRFVFESFTY